MNNKKNACNYRMSMAISFLLYYEMLTEIQVVFTSYVNIDLLLLLIFSCFLITKVIGLFIKQTCKTKSR